MITHTRQIGAWRAAEEIREFEAKGWAVRFISKMGSMSGCDFLVVFECESDKEPL